MQKFLAGLIGGLFILCGSYASGAEITVPMHLLTPQGTGKEIGTVTLADGPYGLLITPHLKDLPPGPHGFHVHENPSCGPGKEGGKTVPGLAAGGHYDPQGTGKHEGPYGQGHLGDLPALCVGKDGRATIPLLAPRLKTGDVQGHSFIIHAGGDNYSDVPAKLGGGGARIACGIVK